MMLTLTWWTIILTCHYLIKGLKSDGRTSTRFDVSQPINLRPSDWIFYPQSTFSSVWILSSVLINTQIDQLEHINIWQGRPKTYFTYKWWPGTHIYINVTHWRNDRDLICITLTDLHSKGWIHTEWRKWKKQIIRKLSVILEFKCEGVCHVVV